MRGQGSKTLAGYFYPRPPRGGRPMPATAKAENTLFLSTPSARRATVFLEVFGAVCFISIHALREEGDFLTSLSASIHWHFYPRPPRGGRLDFLSPTYYTMLYFYPRPPRGGRPPNHGRIYTVIVFLSTPSARRATTCCCASMPATTISIHALREEGDARCCCAAAAAQFLSTPSARRAT